MNIRNFSIIAHIDHGKSTLADRLIEATHAIENRKMRDQVLDRMDLERERGITIKMQPIRMDYQGYVINLIDTPGHIDFSYEVSRALTAVEGVVLLVDATQGIQAQTLTTLAAAQAEGKVIIPALSKIDAPLARPDEISADVARLLNIPVADIVYTSGRTGEGIPELLQVIIDRVPAPTSEFGEQAPFRGLIFDFEYSKHRGIIVYTRVMDGKVSKGDKIHFNATGATSQVLEAGTFCPEPKPKDVLLPGEIGYLVTGIKEPGLAEVGDTVEAQHTSLDPLPGYAKPRPVVWASVYPESQDDLVLLRQALERLHLTDSSLSFEEETSGTLGRGFRCGFLGMLHLEIITERLKREFTLSLIVTTPTITYRVIYDDREEVVYTPARFPTHGEMNHVKEVREPWVTVRIISPPAYAESVLPLLYEHEGELTHTETFGDGRFAMEVEMPLRELMRGFFDRVKSVSSGFASLSYELLPERVADVVRLDLLVAGEQVAAFSRVVSRRRVQEEAEKATERLKKHLPRQLFVTKIQAVALGRILSSESIAAMRKDVTGYLYGGDVSRKRKLLDKQKKGKEKMQERASVNIPHHVFLEMVKNDKN